MEPLGSVIISFPRVAWQEPVDDQVSQDGPKLTDGNRKGWEPVDRFPPLAKQLPAVDRGQSMFVSSRGDMEIAHLEFEFLLPMHPHYVRAPQHSPT